jgi:hypothetical protein
MNVRQLRLRGLSLALVSSVALALAGAGAAAAQPSGSATEVERLVESIRKHRSITWHWQRIKGHRRTPSQSLQSITDPERLAALRDLWKRRADRRLMRAKNPPHEQAWRCIQRHEGAWKDPNAPYYGGLQMNKGFQRAHGRYLLRRKGTANRWWPAEQMWIAERAFRSGTGFHPWPNTAHYCGLL